MTNKEKRIFFNWLQKNNLYEQYRYNRYIRMKREFNGRPYKEIILQYAIYDAFIFASTPEGVPFWSRIALQWYIFVKRLGYDI